MNAFAHMQELYHRTCNLSTHFNEKNERKSNFASLSKKIAKIFKKGVDKCRETVYNVSRKGKGVFERKFSESLYLLPRSLTEYLLYINNEGKDVFYVQVTLKFFCLHYFIKRSYKIFKPPALSVGRRKRRLIWEL